VVIAVLAAALAFGIFTAIAADRMSLIPSMTFQQMLKYTTKDNKDAIITVGIIKGASMSYTAYGESGTILPRKEYTYEIGSATKTFTCSLLCKAISEERVKLTDSIDKYISLPASNYYPTFEKLVTHTSGYKGYYFNWQMANNFFHGQKNDFYGINKETLNKQISAHIVQEKEYPFYYSNFGISVVGIALSHIYGKDYTSVMNDFIVSDLGLEHTKISDGTGDLKGYWNWKSDDGYIPAGAITSTIGDMLEYVDLHMTESIPYLALGHQEVAEINATKKQYEKMNVRMDAAGIGWMIDKQNNIIWHNGGTSNFNSYIAFDPKDQVGVVILSNLSPNYRIPATIMGARLMLDLKSKE
jgi:CubicO group peptidase (beta-lactamase class C family)